MSARTWKTTRYLSSCCCHMFLSSEEFNRQLSSKGCIIHCMCVSHMFLVFLYFSFFYSLSSPLLLFFPRKTIEVWSWRFCRMVLSPVKQVYMLVWRKGVSASGPTSSLSLQFLFAIFYVLVLSLSMFVLCATSSSLLVFILFLFSWKSHL